MAMRNHQDLDDMIIDVMSDASGIVESGSRDRLFVQEELERKLRFRVDRDDLVQKNILPAVSTSPALLAQTQQLQKKKTIDTLQKKLRERAEKSDLQRRNILFDLKGDPALQATQLQLERRRLADNLNERIANRPGPLQLVKGGILEPTNRELAKALETANTQPSDNLPSSQQPQFRLSVSETSPPSPSLVMREMKFSDSSSPTHSPGDPYPEVCSPQKSPPTLSLSAHIPVPKILQSVSTIGKAPSPSQARKKQQLSKPKYRKLRYHEYVPPNKNNGKGGKTAPSKPPKLDSPYALLLQQQQLFLQLQVLQQQYPNGAVMQKLPDLLKNVPAGLVLEKGLLKPKTQASSTADSGRSSVAKTHDIPDEIKVQNPAEGGTLISVRPDELKVNNLKAACKEMNLIVSGKKVELIERLLEHNNGVLPPSVLSEVSKDRRHTLTNTPSMDSQPSNVSPPSPGPSPVFNFTSDGQLSVGCTTTAASSSWAAVETCPAILSSASSAVPQVVPAKTMQHQFEQLVEQRKINYLTQNGKRGVVPRPDLNEMVAIKLPCSDSQTTGTGMPQQAKSSNSLTRTAGLALSQACNSTAAIKQSKSLPSSPQQLSPVDSTNSLLHELMEQSPRPASTNSQQNVAATESLDVPGLTLSSQFSNAQSRPVRSSLPNPPPPYPPSLRSQQQAGQQQQQQQQATSSLQTYALPAYPGGAHQSRLSAMQRSMSLSAAPPSHSSLALHGSSSLGVDLPPLSVPSDPYMLPTEDSENYMEVEQGFVTDHQLTDLFEILRNEDQDLASSLNQPAGPYSYGVDSRLPPRQDSTQSDTVMFGMSAMNSSLAQQSKSGSDACLLNTGRGEMKPPLGMPSAGSGLGGYNDLSWLNIDNSTFLSSSPNMSSYCGDMMSSLGPTVSMNDNFPLLNEGMVRSGNPTLNEFANHSEMNPFMDSVTSGPFATDNSQLLDLHLNS